MGKRPFVIKLREEMPRFYLLAKGVMKAISSPSYHLRIAMNDIKALFGFMPGETKTIFVAGYPKSGTTWVENFISCIPGYNPRELSGSWEVLSQHGLPPDAFDNIPVYGYSAIKTHIMPSDENIDVLVRNGICKVLVMYRDPRDIIVSHYHHVLKANPWRESDPWYADYTLMAKDDAISHSMHMVIDDYCSWVGGWKAVCESNSDIKCLIITYEDMLQKPKQIFTNILSFFGIRLSESRLNSIMSTSDDKSTSALVTSKVPGKKSTKRKGVSGGWKSELNADQKKEFKEKAGYLLIELGYEKDCEW